MSLFDLKKDPIEARDVAADHPLTVAALADALVPFISKAKGD